MIRLSDLDRRPYKTLTVNPATGTANGQTVFVTVHPSYLLRLPDAAAKAREYDAFVRDLKTIRALMEALP